MILTSEPGRVIVPDAAVHAQGPGGPEAGVGHKHRGGAGDGVLKDLAPGPGLAPSSRAPIAVWQLTLALTQLDIALVKCSVGGGELNQGPQGGVRPAPALVIAPLGDEVVIGSAASVVHQRDHRPGEVEGEAVPDHEPGVWPGVHELGPQVVADTGLAGPELPDPVPQAEADQADVRLGLTGSGPATREAEQSVLQEVNRGVSPHRHHHTPVPRLL